MLSDKQSDSFIIEIPNLRESLTKRNILQILASIYNALGFISRYLLTRKVTYQFACELKIPWDKEIPRENQNQWLKWTRDLHDKIKLPNSIPVKGKQNFCCSIRSCKSGKYIQSKFNNQ